MVGDPVHVAYTSTSNTVPIPPSFLTGPAPAALQISHIDFASTDVPEFAGSIAFTIDNVLSRDECVQLIRLASASAASDDGESPWKEAMITLARGVAATAPDYRSCGRIIWDMPLLTERIWERMLQAPGVKDMLGQVVPEGSFDSQRWEFLRLNERMRFLQYEKGQYFKAHCDGPSYFEEDGVEVFSHFTVQLYLNDSVAATGTGEGCVGGATAFLSRKRDRRVDVNPKAGSVLVFQHSGLRHEGAEVKEGVKYTMRTDILYKWVDESAKSRRR